MTSDGLEDTFEGDNADTCTEQFPLMLMVVMSDALKHAQTGSEDTHGNFFKCNEAKSEEAMYQCCGGLFNEK